ncbi:MAG: hypothetical protein ACR2LA_08425 [Acidimicrobiales bacterium]
MKIEFRKVSKGYRRQGKGRNKGLVLAIVDGTITVCCKEGIGWDCSCPDEACPHVDAVADLVALDVVEAIECL